MSYTFPEKAGWALLLLMDEPLDSCQTNLISTLIGRKRIWGSQKDIKEKENLFLLSKDHKNIIWKWEHQALQGESRCYRKRVQLCSDVSSDPALGGRCLEWDQTFLQSLTEYWINCLTFRSTEQMFISFPLQYSYFFFIT